MINRNSFSSYGGRGSPYSSGLGNNSPSNLSSHFEYIGEDHDIYQNHRPSVAVEDDPDNPEDPDIIRVRNMARLINCEFPPYSISEERATVKDLRNRVAASLNVDPRRISLVYKDRELKHNSWPLRRYHMKQHSQCSAIVTESYSDYNGPDNHSSSGEESGSGSSAHVNPRRTRPRGHSTVRHRSEEQIPRPVNGGTFLHPNGHVGAPPDRSHRNSLRPDGPDDRSSRGGLKPDDVRREPSRSRGTSPLPPSGQSSTPSATVSADPNSPLGKLQAISSTFYTRWLPDSTKFTLHPPSDELLREKEYRKLSESIMQQVVLKADNVETEGNAEARAFRKNLVNQANEVMKKLDAVMGKQRS